MWATKSYIPFNNIKSLWEVPSRSGGHKSDYIEYQSLQVAVVLASSLDWRQKYLKEICVVCCKYYDVDSCLVSSIIYNTNKCMVQLFVHHILLGVLLLLKCHWNYSYGQKLSLFQQLRIYWSLDNGWQNLSAPGTDIHVLTSDRLFLAVWLMARTQCDYGTQL